MLGVTAQAVTAYLNAQIEAGAQAVMIFDSWGGALAGMTPTGVLAGLHARIIAGLTREHDGERMPVIVFTKGGGQWLEDIAEAAADAVGPRLDHRHRRWRAARRRQGCAAGQPRSVRAVRQPGSRCRRSRKVLDAYGPGTPATSSTSGHGISQFTPPEQRDRAGRTVHEHSGPCAPG
jgi:uroporphyrinogen decarboxylase